MSKYTTEVRFLCESLTGHDSSVGFNSAKDVIENACPYIFDFDFPIFDEQYRLPLEIKILRHYYTREIGEETYGLWKLRLEDRLNVIMPYYNKLYESTLLSFNPFYDVDLTTNHSGSNNESVNESNREIYDKTNSKTSEENHGGSDTTIKAGENENITNNTKVFDGNETRNDANVKTGDNSNNKETTGNITNVHTGDVKDERNGEHVITNNGSEENNNNENKTRNIGAEYYGDNVNSSNGDRKTDSVSKTNTDRWNMYSDTPQGGIDGMTIPNASAPTGLENNMYLTNATHEVTDTNSETNTKEITGNVTTGNEHSKSNENGVENTSGNQKTISDNVESGNVSDKNVKTYNENNAENHNMNEKTVSGFVETSNENGISNKKENTSDNGSANETYNETNTTAYNKTINNNENGSESGNVDKIGNKVSTNTDEYLQHVIGKSGGMSYAAMLLEFRETFINIDEMIIEELSDLFFGLW